MKILLVEDDCNLAEALQKILSEQHYLVDVAFDGQTGLELAEAYEYDLIVLDIMLPKQSGLRVCQQLRSQRNNVLILLMTVQGESSQKVAGLDAGADDYLTKPIDIPEFLARIRALLRREGAGLPILEWQDLQLDPQSCRVSRHEQLLSLTAKEYELLELFLRNPKRIFSQRTLVERVWSIEELPTENAVRAHIKRLRQKLHQVGLKDSIETVYGLGYRLRQVDPDGSSAPLIQPSNAEIEAGQGVQLFNLWQQYRPEYIERAAVLYQAIAALAQGQQDSKFAAQQAQDQAHTLAGSLGSFGIEFASQLAYQIEQRLKVDVPLKPSELQHFQTLARTIQTEIQTATEDLPIEILTPYEMSHTIQLLIVDDDPALANQLAKLSAAYGIQAQIETDLVAAQARLTCTQPDVVLLDLGFPNAPKAGLDLLSDLSVQWPHIPVIVFTAHDQFSDRLQSANLGGRFFLQKPVLPGTVINTVIQAYTQLGPTDIKLMLIEDDPKTAETIQSILSSWGFQIDIVKNVMQGWKTLPVYQPNLLLLSVELPNCSGFDFCQVIRHEPGWSDLPVIFLVANPEPATTRQMCEVGATACVSKSALEEDLVTRILHCIWRTHRFHNTAALFSNKS